MVIHVDLNKCLEYNVKPEFICFLYEVHYSKQATLSLYEPTIVDYLLKNKFLLNDSPYILSAKGLDCIGLQPTNINPREFINLFPHKVRTPMGWRPIRPKGEDTDTYQKLCGQYLDKVRSIEEHSKICQDTEAFVKAELEKNNGFYIPAVVTVIAEKKWELWDGLIEEQDLTEEYGDTV